MENIPAVANNKTLVNNAEFVKLTIYNDVNNTANTTVLTFSSAYQYETIGNVQYSPFGGLLGVGVQQRDIRVTSSDTSVSISGIDGNNIQVVLESQGKIRGSKLEIIRGFYDSNYNLSNTAQRFTGIITSYNLNENREGIDDTYSITLNASSYKTILDNRVAGRKTNPESWNYFDSTDSSMNNIYSIANQYFDFGKKPIEGTTNKSATQNENQNASDSAFFDGA